MNYKSLFDPKSISSALRYLVRIEKYKKYRIKSLNDFKVSEISRHYRTKKNFSKDVVRFLLNDKKKLHRFTLEKYASKCYWQYRKKSELIQQFFGNAEIKGKCKYY